MAELSNADRCALEMDSALIEKYLFAGQPYRRYPPAKRYSAGFTPGDALRQLRLRGESRGAAPLTLEVNVPFCDAGCHTCASVPAVTGDRARAAEYAAYLEREIVTQRGALCRDQQVAELRWVGGTPTFVGIEELARLMHVLREYFEFLPDAECAVELDPRAVSAHAVTRLGALGFNRLELGVQDFDAAVQQQIGRVQSLEDTSRAVVAARDAGIRYVSVALMYGLPGQSAQSIARTLDTALRLQPDGVELQRYVHLPQTHPAQRRIDAAALPARDETNRMLARAVTELGAAGYAYRSTGWFVRAAGLQAAEQALQAPGARRDLLGFGAAAVSTVGNACSQNHGDLAKYFASIERGALPVSRGLHLDADALLRRYVIEQLADGFELRYGDFSQRHGVGFDVYFTPEREPLAALAAERVIELAPKGLRVTPQGKLVAHAVCRVFDRDAGAAGVAI